MFEICNRTCDAFVWYFDGGSSLGNIDLLTNLLTPWSGVLLEKLTGSQLVKSPHLMEPEGSLPHSQVPATCPNPEAARSSPRPHIQLPESSLIVSSHLCLGFPSGLFFPQVSPPKPLCTSPPSICATFPAHLILIYLITGMFC